VFLIEWFSGHVRPLPSLQRVAEAARLATDCRKDAVAAGIPLAEVRDAVGSDLIRKILEALDTVATLTDNGHLAADRAAALEADDAPRLAAKRLPSAALGSDLAARRR